MKMLILVVGILLSCNSIASDAFKGKVARLWIQTSTTLVRVDIEGNQNNAPTCHTNTIYDFIFDISTEQGKQIYSALLAAYHSGKETSVKGLDTCASATEELAWVLAN